MYTLEEAISELRKIEPYWNRCFPCKNQGKCCIGADVTIYKSEWNKIYSYLNNLPDLEKSIVMSNLQLNKLCIFRSEEKCLIHKVRPENCLYTPFQYLVTDDNYLLYTMVSTNCSFKSVRKKLELEDAEQLRRSKFAKLINFAVLSWYVSLNYLVANQSILSKNEISNSASNWAIRQFFQS